MKSLSADPSKAETEMDPTGLTDATAGFSHKANGSFAALLC